METDTKKRLSSVASLGAGPYMIYKGIGLIGEDPLSGLLLTGGGFALLVFRDFWSKKATG